MLLEFIFTANDYQIINRKHESLSTTTTEVGSIVINIPTHNRIFNTGEQISNLKALVASLGYGLKYFTTPQGKQLLTERVVDKFHPVATQKSYPMAKTECGNKVLYRTIQSKKDQLRTHIICKINALGIELHPHSWETDFCQHVYPQLTVPIFVPENLQSAQLLRCGFCNAVGVTPASQILKDMIPHMSQQMNNLLNQLMLAQQSQFDDFCKEKDEERMLKSFGDNEEIKQLFINVRKCEKEDKPTPKGRTSALLLHYRYDYIREDSHSGAVTCADEKPLAPYLPDTSRCPADVVITEDNLKQYIQTFMTKPDSVCDKTNKEPVAKKADVQLPK